MSSASRTENIKRNVLWGYIAQIGVLLLSFLGRRLFLHFLSVDYLGVNGLYTNVLQVLSLAELGLGTAITFSLYKPLASGDEAYIRSLVRYARRLYLFIALAVLAIGLALIPFLPRIVNSELPLSQLILYYVLYLVNSTMSYFVAHKSALVAASQNHRLQKRVELGMAFFAQVLHIAVLLLWHNYTVYVVATLLCTALSNLALGVIVDKRYPYLRDKAAPVAVDRVGIAANIRSTFLYKLGTVAINSTDNILISMLVSTAAVGLYSNYLVVVYAVQGFVSTVTVSLLSGIGSLHAESNRARMLEVFDVMLLTYHAVAAACGVCFFYLFNDLIPIWLGTAYLLDTPTVFAIAFNFYLTNAISPIWMFRESTGLFNRVKYLMLVTAFCNIVLSVIFGKLWGTFGILIASAAARILTAFWYEPMILFQNVFDAGASHYWRRQAKYFLCTLLTAALCLPLARAPWRSLPFLAIKGIAFFAVTGGVFYLACRKTPEFAEARGMVRKLVGR